MKVLITGGAGYVGTELAYALAEDTSISEVIVYDNLSRPNFNLFIGNRKLDSKVRLVKGDILDSRKLKREIGQVDVVYHLAAKVTTPFADQNPHLFDQVNHWGTAEVVFAVENSSVKQFVYLSSVSVYGSSVDIVNEDTVPNPQNFYAISKLKGEEQVQRLMTKLPTHIVRCANVYGYSKSMRFDAVINKFMFNAVFEGRIAIDGDGRQKRAFTYFQNAVDCLAGLLRLELDSGIYNLVDVNKSVLGIAEMTKEIVPGLEMIFINQQMKLRQIQAASNTKLDVLKRTEFSDLKKNLVALRRSFTL